MLASDRMLPSISVSEPFFLTKRVTTMPDTLRPGLRYLPDISPTVLSRAPRPAMEHSSALIGTTTSSAAMSARRESRPHVGGQSMTHRS